MKEIDMKIKKAIEATLCLVPLGMFFDSHFVIEELRKNQREDYDEFMNQYAHPDELPAHQRIGHIIKEFEGKGVVKRQQGQSWSENIHGKASECALWRKV
jgi:hypothetical protein